MRAIAVVMLMMSGCVSMAPFRARDFAAPNRTKAQLYSGAVRAIAEEGLDVAIGDDTGGIVTTDWYEGQASALHKMRMRWRILVDDGTVRVDSDCQTAETDSQNWSPCSGGQRPEGHGARASDLANKIIREAERIAAKKPAPVAAPPAQATVEPAASVEPAPPTQ